MSPLLPHYIYCTIVLTVAMTPLHLLLCVTLAVARDEVRTEVGSAVAELARGRDLATTSRNMTEAARASLSSISNINLFGEQRHKPMV